MNCNLCDKEIKKGERAIEVSYGNVYIVMGRSEIVGDHFEYFHMDCFKPTWRKKVWIISRYDVFRGDRVNIKGFDSKGEVENWINDHPNREYQVDDIEVE